MAKIKSGEPRLFGQDLTGEVFGFITVIRKRNASDIAGPQGNRLSWLGRCACGNQKLYSGSDLRLGRILSCGCRRFELISIAKRTHGMSRSRHERTTTQRIYRIWSGIKRRCDNPQSHAYKDYGGRGISYQKSWDSFENFWTDMKDGYRNDLTIERIDVNGNYTKENCRWATRLEQGNNTRTNRVLEFRGVKKTMSEWCRIVVLPMKTVHLRLKNGWSVERALTQPVHHTKAFLQRRKEPSKH